MLMSLVKGSCVIGMFGGSCLEKFIVFCIFMQYDIRAVLKKKVAKHAFNWVAQEPLTSFLKVNQSNAAIHLPLTAFS